MHAQVLWPFLLSAALALAEEAKPIVWPTNVVRTDFYSFLTGCLAGEEPATSPTYVPSCRRTGTSGSMLTQCTVKGATVESQFASADCSGDAFGQSVTFNNTRKDQYHFGGLAAAAPTLRCPRPHHLFSQCAALYSGWAPASPPVSILSQPCPQPPARHHTSRPRVLSRDLGHQGVGVPSCQASA
jgi:hypothetical protein